MEIMGDKNSAKAFLNKGQKEGESSDSYSESTRTVICYMLNLLTMITMCIIVMGIMIIYLVVLLEGSLWINPAILAHLTIPVCVLIFNIYIIMLDDQEELKYFRRGNGQFLLNLSFLGTLTIFSFTIIYKVLQAYSDPIQQYAYNSNTSSDELTESVLYVEEYFLYGLAFLESLTLKEYAKAKLKDLLSRKLK